MTNMNNSCEKCIHYPVCENKNYNIVKPCDFYEVKAITRGNCMLCGEDLTEGLFFCKECEEKGKQAVNNSDIALEAIRRLHESVMAEFNPNTSIFDGLTEEEMWLMFLVLNQMRKEADNE